MKKIIITLLAAATLAAPLFGAATREDQPSQIIDWALERYGLKMPEGKAQNLIAIRERDISSEHLSHLPQPFQKFVHSQAGRLNYDLAERTLKEIFHANIGKYLPLTIREKATLDLEGNNFFGESLVFSPCGQYLASASHKNTVKLWNLNTNECEYTFKGHRDTITCVAFSPDGRHLASGSCDNTIKLWDLRTRKCVHTLEEYESAPVSVIFSPDGRYLASGSANSGKLWDLKTRQCVHTLKGDSKCVRLVAFSPCGNLLASASEFEPVKLWGIPDNLTTEQMCCVMLITEFYNPETDETVPDCFERIEEATDISTDELNCVWNSIHNSEE